MSIWNEIKAAQKPDKLDLKDFEDLLKAFEKNEPAREFIVQTGVSGMKIIQDSMQTQVYLTLMKDLNFSREERKRLGTMINSPDPENFQIAKILIDNKLAEAREYHKK